MKKLFLALLLVLMFVVPAMADGPSLDDSIYDASLQAIIDNTDTIGLGTDGTWANIGWSHSASGLLSIVSGAVDGRALQIAATSDTASATQASNDTILFYDSDGSLNSGGAEVIGCAPLDAAISFTSGETYAFGTTSVFTAKDVIETP